MSRKGELKKQSKKLEGNSLNNPSNFYNFRNIRGEKMDQIYNNENIENRIEVFCSVIDSVIKSLKKPKRIQIIKTIYHSEKPLTFKEIEEQTKIPTTTLHDNMEVLYVRNIITKTDDRPSKYLLTDFAKELLGIKINVT